MARKSVEDELDAAGHAVRPVLDRSALTTLRGTFDELDMPARQPMYRSFADDTRERAAAIDRTVRSVLGPAMQPILPGYRAVLGMFIHKGANAGSLDFHQDWTFTDERTHRAVIVWAPLTDVSVENGTLAVIPGSHRWVNGIRCSTKVVTGPTVDHQPAMERLARHIPLRAGEALMYDARTVHGSSPNATNVGRPIALVMMLPHGAPVVHFHESEAGVEGFVVDGSFFTDHEFESKPVGYPSIAPWVTPVRSADYVDPMARQTRPSIRRSISRLHQASRRA